MEETAGVHYWIRRSGTASTENRILRNQINGRVRLTDGERGTLADLAKKLGKKALEEIANIVKPDTLLAWYRRLIANKFDGSKNRRYPGRPRVDAEIEELVVQFAGENRTWGYDRIAGALRNLGHKVSDQSVGNILRRHDIPPAPVRGKTTTWKEFIRSHMDVFAATASSARHFEIPSRWSVRKRSSFLQGVRI